MLLENGYLVLLGLNWTTCELESISIDKSLYSVYKNAITCATLFDQYCVFSQANDLSLHLFQFGSKSKKAVSCVMPFAHPYDKRIPLTICKELTLNPSTSLICARYEANTMAVLNLSTEQQMDVLTFLPLGSQQTEVMDLNFSIRKPFTIQAIELSSQTSVYWNIYERGKNRDFKKTRAHKIKTTSPVTCCAISPSEDHVCICCSDGTILLWTRDNSEASLSSPSSNSKLKITIQRIHSKSDPFIVKWHQHGGVLLIGFNSDLEAKQEFCFFDLGLNLLHISLPNGILAQSLTSRNLIGRKSKMVKNLMFLHSQVLYNDNYLLDSRLARAYPNNSLFFLFDRGPMVIVKIDLTLVASLSEVRPLSNMHVLLMHLHENAIEESRTLIRNITNPTEMYTALCVFVNHLLRQLDVASVAAIARDHLDKILEKYAKLFKETPSAATTLIDPSLPSRSAQLHNLYRRYFIYTIRHGYYEKAFQIAAALSDEDMFQQIYHATREHRYNEMGYLCFMKSSESFKKHMRQLKQFLKKGAATVESRVGPTKSLNDLLKRYEENPHQYWNAEEAEQLGTYFEMCGDLQTASFCYSLTPHGQEHVMRVTVMQDILQDYGEQVFPTYQQ